MFYWREQSKDPTELKLIYALDAFLQSITKFEEVSRIELILNFCRGKDVLDIGAGEHDISLYSKEGWEHGLISDVAKRTVAAELLPELCEYYNKQGFDFRCIDATSDSYLGEKFDFVFIGDVIEHVNDPVALLKFAKRHLKKEGRILITTPNPFAPRFRWRRITTKRKYVIANLEHVSWISLSNIHEISTRANLEMAALYWPLASKPNKYYLKNMQILAKKLLSRILPVEELFAEYIIEFKLPNKED